MYTKEEIFVSLHQYLTQFPYEQEEVTPLIRFMNSHKGEELINRKNFTGHITTSAFIINENGDALLLLKHKALNRWLQPGGHVDVTDVSLQLSALREACEETGLTAVDLTLISNHIFDIDSHSIPENHRKQEPEHVHHDIRFLFQCSNSRLINISLEESTDSKWISFAQLNNNEDFYWVKEKISNFR